MSDRKGPRICVSPQDTKGWRVVRINRLGKGPLDLWLLPDGTGYRKLMQKDGPKGPARPDIIVRTPHITPRETWLRQLGPRQLADALSGNI